LLNRLNIALNLLNKLNITLSINSLVDDLDIVLEALSFKTKKDIVTLKEKLNIVTRKLDRVYFVNSIVHEYYTNTKSITYLLSLDLLEFCLDTSIGISLLI